MAKAEMKMVATITEKALEFQDMMMGQALEKWGFTKADVEKALVELEGYRNLGTLEECMETIEKCKEYELIGTVRMCEEAVEKMKPKKCEKDICPDHTHYKCPACGKIQKTKYEGQEFGAILNNCPNCGQKLEE